MLLLSSLSLTLSVAVMDTLTPVETADLSMSRGWRRPDRSTDKPMTGACEHKSVLWQKWSRLAWGCWSRRQFKIAKVCIFIT